MKNNPKSSSDILFFIFFQNSESLFARFVSSMLDTLTLDVPAQMIVKTNIL